jgi:hypothetical protein
MFRASFVCLSLAAMLAAAVTPSFAQSSTGSGDPRLDNIADTLNGCQLLPASERPACMEAARRNPSD